MAVLNLGLQCVGLAREAMPDEYEAESAKCNNISELRKMAIKMDGFSDAINDSLSPVKILLCTIFFSPETQGKADTDVCISHSSRDQ